MVDPLVLSPFRGMGRPNRGQGLQSSGSGATGTCLLGVIGSGALAYERKQWVCDQRGCGANSYGCSGASICMQRGRFHVWLAQMGKTELTDEERLLLAPQDADGGSIVSNHRL